MDESEFRSNPPRPGDKVWLKPVVVPDTLGTDLLRVSGVSTEGVRRVFWASEIDRIERTPRAPVVGDRVKHSSGVVGELLAIDGEFGWFRTDLLRCEVLVAHLQVIEP